MANTTAARQSVNVTPPRATQLGVPGSAVAIGVSATPAVLNLSTLFPPPASAPTAVTTGGVGNVGFNPPNSTFSQQTGGVCGQYITVEAYGADVGLITGVAVTDVNGVNAPVIATVGTVDATGAYTVVAGACFIIPAGQSIRFIPVVNQDVFLGFVGSAAGTMRLYQSCGAGS